MGKVFISGAYGDFWGSLEESGRKQYLANNGLRVHDFSISYDTLSIHI